MYNNPTPQINSHYSKGAFAPIRDTNEIAKVLSNITGTDGITVRSDFGRGLQIGFDGSSISHDWEIFAAVGNATFEIRTGIWERNSTTITYAGTSGTPIAPVVAGNIPSTYTGTLYVYAMLTDSHEPTSIKIVPSVAKLEISGYVDPFRMTTLIGILTYASGLITAVAQKQVGSIQDTCDLYCGEFGIKVVKTAYDTFEFYVKGGTAQIRDIVLTAAEVTSVDTSARYWTLDLAAYPNDPSLVPTSATIVANAAWPAIASYQRHHYKLYQTEPKDINTASGATMNYKFPYCLRGGTIHDDWMRPDGKDETLDSISTTYPRGKTLGFVPTGTVHEGELEDFGFTAKVLTGNPMAGATNDAILPWYLFSTAASTEKFYARMDAPNNASHVADSGKSIDLRTVSTYKVVEIYDFFSASGFSKPDASSDFCDANADDGYYSVLARRKVGDVRQVEYISLKDFKPDTCVTADNIPQTGFDGQADDWWAGITVKHTNTSFADWTAALGTGKSGGNTDHDDSYWHAYNDGSGVVGHSTYIDDHSYRTTGTLWTAELHLSADGSTDSQYWTASAIKASVSGKIEMTAGDDSKWVNTDSSKKLSLGLSGAKWGDIDAYTLATINLFSGTTGKWVTADSTKKLSFGISGTIWATVEAWGGSVEFNSGATSKWVPTTNNSYELDIGVSGTVWSKINLRTTDIYINGTQCYSGTIDLTTASTIVVENGLIKSIT